MVHRIVRETSGVLIFAKDFDTQNNIKDHWHDDTHQRYYYALVEGEVEKDDDTIVSWLTENPKSLKVHSSFTDNGGEQAITSYHVICRKKGMSPWRLTLRPEEKTRYVYNCLLLATLLSATGNMVQQPVLSAD